MLKKPKIFVVASRKLVIIIIIEDAPAEFRLKILPARRWQAAFFMLSAGLRGYFGSLLPGRGCSPRLREEVYAMKEE
jgi:hypothetical protein